MTFEEIIRLSVEQRATDIHLEPKIPATIRVNGSLRRLNYAPDANTLRQVAERLLGDDDWGHFQTRGSADLCKPIAGVPCRISVLQTDRGTGFAIRLLATAQNTLKSCNLLPSLAELLDRETGLIILTGPTGSGKSTTLSAMIEEINLRETRHIITLESPIEYRLQPKRSLIRQREVGRHTPSYEQGLMDALREDPDVLVVGEMREADAMRLTLNAAETGHLVLATMHSTSAMDAIYRMMMSFPPERQSSVLAQIADTLIAVVSHKMTYRPDTKILVPCCEVLIANHATRNIIRKAEISKMPSILQTGGPEGMWTFERYQSWLDQKSDWVMPEPPVATDESTFQAEAETERVARPSAPVPTPAARRRSYPQPTQEIAPTEAEEPASPPVLRTVTPPAKTSKKSGKTGAMKIHKDGRIEIPEMDIDLNDLIKEFKDRGDNES